MRSTHGKAGKAHAPIPHGDERARQLAALRAEAESRMRARRSPLWDLTPEKIAEMRTSEEPEIIGRPGLDPSVER